MRQYLITMVVFGMVGCETFNDIEEVEVGGSCTILMIDGTTIVTQENLKIMESTNVITYRDSDGKLWSVPPGEYSSYSCGN